MGGGRPWIAWGAAIIALNLAWEVSIYLAGAWPIYHPFIGMAVGGVLVVIGLVLSVVKWLKHPKTGAAPDRRGM